MLKITEVSPQKKTLRLRSGQGPKRFNVFLDGKFAFGADEDLIVDRRLVVGKMLNPEDLEKLLFGAEVGKLMERMYGLFNIRQRSEKEVRDYLKNLSFKRKLKDKEEISDIAIDSLIEKLKQKRLLNDREFAKSWVSARRRSKGKGIIALKSELFQKGIDRDIVDEILEESTIEAEIELAKKAIEKKWKIWTSLPELEKKKKAYEFLMRKGFEYEAVKSVIEKLIKKE